MAIKEIFKYLNWLIAHLLPLLVLLFMLSGNIYIIAFVFIACIFFITSVETVYPVYWVASLSSMFVVVGDGLSAGRFLSVIMIISLLIRFWRKRRLLDKQKLFVFVTVVIFTFFSALFSITQSLHSFFVMMLNLLVFYLITCLDDINYEKVVKYVAHSSFFVLLYFAYTAYLEGAFLFASRYMEGEHDGPNANNVAMLITQCGAVLCAYLIFVKNIFLKLFSVFGLILSILLVVALGSRAALIALISSFLVCVFFVYSSLSTKRKMVFLSSLSIFVILLVLYSLSIDTPTYITERFSVEHLEDDGGGGRTTNIKIILFRIFPNYLLFGTGIGGENMLAIGKNYNLPNLAHNIIVDPLSQLGIIGYSLYLFFMIPYLWCSLSLFKFKKKLAVLLSLAPMIAALVNGIGEIVFYEKFFWNDLSLCYLAYKTYTRI